jgi:hypothetical protein
MKNPFKPLLDTVEDETLRAQILEVKKTYNEAIALLESLALKSYNDIGRGFVNLQCDEQDVVDARRFLESNSD